MLFFRPAIIITCFHRAKQGQAPDTEIGRVYVYDLDDWDLPDKKFYSDGTEHPRFKLNDTTGMILMRHGTREGQYHLRFKVYDRKHTQTDISANVTVTVKEISTEAVMNAGSIRIAGITDEDFIRIWNYRVSVKNIDSFVFFFFFVIYLTRSLFVFSSFASLDAEFGQE